MIESWHVREALRSRLGSSLVDEPGFADPLAAVLRSYLSYKDTFASLASRVEDTLFNLLYDRLGPSMSVRMNDGSFRRISQPGPAVLCDGIRFLFCHARAVRPLCRTDDRRGKARPCPGDPGCPPCVRLERVAFRQF